MRLGINGRFLAAPATGVQRFAREVVARIMERDPEVALFVPSGVELRGMFSTGTDRRVPPVSSSPEARHRDVGAAEAADIVDGRMRGQAFEQLELPRLARRCDVLLHPANTAGLDAGLLRPTRLAVRGARRAATPFVLVLHDVLPLTNPEWFTRRYALWCRLTVPSAARAAARVVTVSEWSRREIIRATGAAPGRVIVAPQGLAPFDSPASDEAVQRVRERYRLPSRFLLAVGGGARKNLGFLETMLDRWMVKHGDAPALVIAGRGAARVHRSAGLEARGVTLGRVDDDELRALYTAASALCFPSLAEGFGRPPLEAVACGTPAVVAPFAAAAEILAGVGCARVVSLEIDAWIETLRPLVDRTAGDRSRAETSGLRERWSWDAAADVVLEQCARARTDPRVTSMPAVRFAAARPASRQPRIAIVHDWLTGMRGGERVLEELLELYPAADLFALLHVPGSVSPAIEARVVATSYVDRVPGARRAHRLFLPLYPSAAARLDVSGYDLVLSSSHCAAKGVHTGGVPHLCYCHTPMRYVWDRQSDYLRMGLASPLLRLTMLTLAPPLRAWDVHSAARIDRIVANSWHVRERIAATWRRDAAVVHPPVQVDRFEPAARRADYHVIAGALVPYKRVDLAVRAFNDLGRRLLVVGDGPEYARLRALAGRTIEFAGRVEDAELARLLARARALIMPMVEDFGIIAVEAQAAGTPVIALAAGGALETVIGAKADTRYGRPGPSVPPPAATGVFFQQQTPEALAQAVRVADLIDFDVAALRANARRFDRSVFRDAIGAHVGELVGSGA